MKELETLHTCKPALSTNGGRYFIEVQLLWKFKFRNDRGKKIYIVVNGLNPGASVAEI